tara:strand:+ start:749 stop:880 length:132 start_codon:yes stop_codon:yes gene_type:complete
MGAGYIIMKIKIEAEIDTENNQDITTVQEIIELLRNVVEHGED